MTTPAAPATLDLSGTPPVPFWRLVLVELRKSYDTRAGFWLLVSIGGVVGLLLGIATLITVLQDEPVRYVDFVTIAAYIGGVLLPILGIMLVTSEWSQRSAMVTFSLEPRRANVVLAKMVVGVLLTLLTLVAALLMGVACTAICEVANPALTTWEVEAGELAGFAITQALAMLGGFAIATLLLNTPASIVVFFIYRFILPFVIAIAGALIGWFETVGEYINFQLAQGEIANWDLSGGDEWGRFLVSAFVWLVLPTGFGLWRILRAEVK